MYASITNTIPITTNTNVEYEKYPNDEHVFHIHADKIYLNLTLAEAKILVQKLSSIMTEKQL